MVSNEETGMARTSIYLDEQTIKVLNKAKLLVKEPTTTKAFGKIVQEFMAQQEVIAQLTSELKIQTTRAEQAKAIMQKIVEGQRDMKTYLELFSDI